MSMNVLVTGGMGVIGSEVARYLVAKGLRPVLFARHHDESLIRDMEGRVDVETGDVTHLSKLMDVIKRRGISHIVHAAAFVGAVSQENPALSVEVNVMGTLNVLEAARLFDVKRVVYTSAKGVYGPIEGEHAHPTYAPINEDAPKRPQRIYDAAKLMGEHLCQYYSKQMGVETVTLRFATTYGPGKTKRHGNMGVTSRIVEAPAAGECVRIAGGGEQLDDFIYNKDSAKAVYLALVAGDVKSGVYNIGSGIGVSLRDFEAGIKRHLPDADIEIGPGLNFLGLPYSPHGIYDTTRAREELGFTPSFDLDSAIEDYLVSLGRIGRTQAGAANDGDN